MLERRRLFRDEAFARRGRTEPIDGLLRVSAPHEWLFLVALFLALLCALAWGVFGTFERGLTTPCVLVSPVGDANAEAVALLPAEGSRSVSEGMGVRLYGHGDSGSFDGRIVDVSLDSSDLPASTVLRGEDPGRLARVELAGAPASMGAGDACNIRIVTNREAPIRLITGIGPG